MKAHLSEDRREVVLVGDGWEGSFPVEQIDQQHHHLEEFAEMCRPRIGRIAAIDPLGNQGPDLPC